MAVVRWFLLGCEKEVSARGVGGSGEMDIPWPSYCHGEGGHEEEEEVIVV